MAWAASDPVELDPRQLRGIKPLRRLLPLLASLHEVGCGRDRAGNRDLHFDQYVTLVLLMLLNPLIDSLRALQHAASWLVKKEVRMRGDWKENNPHPEASGWAFEYNNVFYPDTDDTAMVLMALRLVRPNEQLKLSI